MIRLLVIALMLVSGPAGADVLRLGWAAWSDAEIMSRMAKVLIDEHTPHRVDRVLADIGIQYSGVARGHLDFMMMSWQPQTHRDYLDKFGDDLEDLGVLYAGARLGWAVPAYMSSERVGSIADLAKPEVSRALGWRIQGIDPGAGLTRLSERALRVYRLDDYQLQYASGAGMAVALQRAIDRKRWIVVTAWRPHWIFGQFDLRFLDDPKSVLSSNESVHVIARKGFRTDYPEVAGILSRMHLPLPMLEAIMLDAQRTDYQQAVLRFLDSHPDLVDEWLTPVP